MKITAMMVKELRDRTGAGFMDCKKVLIECDGDQEKAIETLRKKGAQIASARAGRVASEGIIVCQVSESGDCGALVEVNCETDFVSRGDIFRDFALPLGDIALSIDADCDDVEVLNAMPFGDSDQTVGEECLNLVSRIREKISVRRLRVIKAPEGSFIGKYLHRGKIGVLSELSGENDASIANDISIQMVATNPKWIDASQIPGDVLAKEREIYLDQARDSGKPEHILDKIVSGRIRKFKTENTLVGQPFYKDEDKTVGAVLKSKKVTVTRVARLDLGM